MHWRKGQKSITYFHFILCICMCGHDVFVLVVGVWNFFFKIGKTKIFCTTPHLISQHSPPLEGDFFFNFFHMHWRKGQKSIPSITYFHFILCICMWDLDVVVLVVGVWNFFKDWEDQNLLYHSPLNFAALPTTGRRFFIKFYTYALKERTEIHSIHYLLSFHFVYLYVRSRCVCPCGGRLNFFFLKLGRPKSFVPLPT